MDEILGEYLETLRDIESTDACIAGVIDRPCAANVLRLLRLYDIDSDTFDTDDTCSTDIHDIVIEITAVS